MKFFLLLALIASVAAVPYGGSVNTGHSANYRSDDGYGNYEFGYNEDHATGGTFRKEKGGPGYQVGSYGLRDADGRLRIVHYIADAHGFRATISTNEPGVDVKQDPAATSLTSAGGPHTALAPVALAPQAYAEPEPSGAHYAEPVPAAPIHYNEPLYGHASQAVVSKAAYEPQLDHYSPALAAPLMANAYEAPILKSAYVPDYLPAESHYAPNAHYGAVPVYGQRLYSNNHGYNHGYY